MDQASKAGPAPGEPVFEVPIQTLEEALERPFLPDDLKDIDLEMEDCERLYNVLYAYHQDNRIQPVATANTVRPNLSFVSLASGVVVDRSTPPYVAGTYLPRNGEFRVPIEEIKSTLLFADAVVIEDPVFAFCRAVMCTRYMEAIPAYHVLEENLQQLAALRPLLEKRLLRLTSYFPEPVKVSRQDTPRQPDGTFVVGDFAAATAYRDERVLKLVAGDGPVPDFARVSADERRLFIRDLMRQDGDKFQWLYRQAESLVFGTADPDAYCPHLPGEYQYGIYKELLKRNAKRIDDLNVQVVMELNSGCAIDPDRIKLDELLDIRRDEQVFSSWRELVRQAVNMAEARKQEDVARLDIFKDEVSNRGRDWQANFQKYNKGRLKDVMTASKEVSIGSFKALLAPARAPCLIHPASWLWGVCSTAFTNRRAASRTPWTAGRRKLRRCRFSRRFGIRLHRTDRSPCPRLQFCSAAPLRSSHNNPCGQSAAEARQGWHAKRKPNSKRRSLN
jgi:hypothetical protein